MRILSRLGAGLLLLVAVAAFVLWWRLDTIARRVIERDASEHLGVATEIDRVLLHPIAGALALHGLRVANPPGYAGPFLVVQRARAELDLATLRHELIEVREVALDGVAVELEQGHGGSNYDAIVSRLGAKEPAAEAAASGPTLRVRDLYVRNITARVRLAPAPGVTVQIPEIHLTRLGGPQGASSGEVTAEVVRAILTSVATEVPGVPVALAGRLLGGLGPSGAAARLREAGERGLDAARGAWHDLLGTH